MRTINLRVTYLLLVCVGLWAAPAWPQDITTGLVGRWLLNEGTGGQGTTIVDSSATGAHGTISGTGTPTWIADNRGGQGLSISAINTYVTIPDNPAYDFGTGNFTAAFWVKGNYTAFVVCKDVEAGNANGLYVYQGSGNVYNYWNGTSAVSFAPLTTDTGWHHLVAVRAGTGTNQGQLYSDNVAGNVFTDGRTLSNAHPLRFFGCVDTTATLTGSLGRVDLFNRALSAADVTALFNASDAPPASAPKRRPLWFSQVPWLRRFYVTHR